MPDWKLLITRENLLAAVSVIALLLSIFNFAESRWTNKKKVTIAAPFAFSDSGGVLLQLTFVNKSRLPLTITRLTLSDGNLSHQVGARSITFYEYLHPERKGKHIEETTRLPLELESLKSAGGIFFIDSTSQIPGRNISLTIETNRGNMHVSTEIEHIIDDFHELTRYL